MKLAIVHDYLNQFGGAERVVEVFHEIFPQAPIFTSIYIPENLPASFRSMDIRTSFMQKLPFLKKHFKKYLMLYPLAFKSFDLSQFDVILSSSSAFAKGVNKGPQALHISYCYTPARFIWRYEDYVERENFGVLTRKLLAIFISQLKKWDLKTAKNVDYYIAISQAIAQRIKNIYNRDSTIIYPPVDIEKFISHKSQVISHKLQVTSYESRFFLVVSRLSPYKRIDIAIEAFNELGLPLKIVGAGPDLNRLKQMAQANVEFCGKINDADLANMYSNCRALIFPGEEDFGITVVEAQACGKPVIAFRGGGALETVIEGQTGLFFDEPTADSLKKAVVKFSQMSFDAGLIRKNAKRFGKEIFKQKIKKFVEEKVGG